MTNEKVKEFAPLTVVTACEFWMLGIRIYAGTPNPQFELMPMHESKGGFLGAVRYIKSTNSLPKLTCLTYWAELNVCDPPDEIKEAVPCAIPPVAESMPPKNCNGTMYFACLAFCIGLLIKLSEHRRHPS